MFFRKKDKNQAEQKLLESFCLSYQERFPELDNLVFFYNHEPIFISDKLKATLNKKQQKEINKLGKEKFKALNKSKTIAYANNSVEIKGLEKNIKTLSVNINRLDGMDFVEYCQTIDHEFGHLLTGASLSLDKASYNEAKAESFAGMMSIIKFNSTDTHVFKLLPYEVAGNLLMGSVIHYFSDSLFAVEKLSEKVDFKKLSNEELITYSKVIAEKTYTPVDKLLELRTEFNKKSRTFEDITITIAATTLDCKDNEDLYRVGKLYLESLKIKDPQHNNILFLKNIYKEMAEHEQATGFILNPIDAKEKRENINLSDEIIKEAERRLSIKNRMPKF